MNGEKLCLDPRRVGGVVRGDWWWRGVGEGTVLEDYDGGWTCVQLITIQADFVYNCNKDARSHVLHLGGNLA